MRWTGGRRMRAIDADRLLTDRMKEHYYHLPNGDIAIPIIDIEHAPTIVPERKRGKWLANGDILKECSFCGEDWDKYVFGDIWYTGELPKFCPNCGAEMKEEEG